MYYIGIDLGGTNIAGAIVNGDGQILAKLSDKTPISHSPRDVAGGIAAIYNRLLEGFGLSDDEVYSVGIGSPGICDPDTGVVEYSCNLDFHSVPLAKLVSDLVHKPVYLGNDANSAALGEYAAGCGRGSDSLVAITLGTGIGGGIVIADKLLTGFNHAGAELGHFVIQKDGEPCGCGRKGCFEAYASATALIRITKSAMIKDKNSLMWQLAKTLEDVDGLTSFDAMRMGDKTAKAVVDEYVENLACGLASIINIFQPRILCLGGGVANEGEALIEPVRKLIDKEEYSRDLPNRTTILKATLGNDAGIIGAALLPLFR